MSYKGNCEAGQRKGNKLSKQDDRLTGRHIKALMDLQDAKLANEELKSKLDVTMRELSSCYELHELARSSQKKLSSSEKRLEEVLQILKCREEEIMDIRKHHDMEIAKLKAINSKLEVETSKAREKKTLYEEKLISVEEKDRLIEKLEKRCKDLDEMLIGATSALNTKVMRAEELEKEAASLREKNATLEGDLQQRKEQLDSVQKDQSSRKRLIDKLTDDYLANTEVSQLKEDVQVLKTGLEEKDVEVEELKEQTSILKHLLSIETNKVRLMEMERDTIMQSADDLRNDLEYLQTQMNNLKVTQQSDLSVSQVALSTTRPPVHDNNQSSSISGRLKSSAKRSYNSKSTK